MIADRAVSEGLIRPNLRTLSAILEEEILGEIARDGHQFEFVRMKTGHYGLRSLQGRYGHSVADQAAPALTSVPFPRDRYDSDVTNNPTTHDLDYDLAPENPKDFSIFTESEPKLLGDKGRTWISGDYVGRGGEHLVASKLLFLRHDVSMPIVDIGADLITTSDLGYNFIQVKTATSKRSSYRIVVKTKTFQKHVGKKCFMCLCSAAYPHPLPQRTF